MTETSAERLTSVVAGRYEIERKLGAGGMATVYLARDLKHDRQVALKVLRPELAAVVGGQRFLKEIRITAKLDHPHILTLIDSGESDDVVWYALPYVRGETLRQKLDREKQLAIDDAVAITRDIAGALDYAHRQGVIHRDIKPENILLFEGEAMLADFGIALAITQAGGPRLTESGLSLGTPQYMSPEQATGDRDLDPRTDVYSLGAVLYEMLAGEAPHTGPSTQAVIAKLLTERPTRLRIVRDTVTEELDGVVAKALAKLPADRYSSAAQFAHSLALAAATTSRETAPWLDRIRGSEKSRQTWVALGVGSLLIILAVGALWFAKQAARGPSPTAAARQVTFTGKVEVADISRDGRFLAYASREGPKRKILVQDLRGGGTPRDLASLDWVSDVRWSPTGSQLLVSGVEAGRTVAQLVPLLGGSMRSLPAAAVFPGGNLLTCWSPDGSQVAMFTNSSKRILLVDVASGDTTPIRLRGSFTWLPSAPEWSPNGTLIALVASTETPLRYTLLVVASDGSRQQVVAEDTAALASPRWSPLGDALYYVQAGSELRRIGVARETGFPKDSPKTLHSGLQTFNRFNQAEAAALSVTRDGARLAYTRGTAHANLWRLTAGAAPARHQLTTGTAAKSAVAVSPDGRWIAFVQGSTTRGDLFKIPVEGGVPQRLTLTGRAVVGFTGSNSVAWSPDGTQLAFGVMSEGPRVATISADGGTARVFDKTRLSSGATNIAWAPGVRILYNRQGNRNFHLLDPGTGREQPLVSNDSVGWMPTAQYSPEADRVAVGWNRSPHGPSVWVISLRDSSQVLLGKGWHWPFAWSREGRSVYTVNPLAQEPGIRLIPLSGGPPRALASLPSPNSACALVGLSQPPSFVCMIPEYISDVWLIEHFDPAIR